MLHLGWEQFQHDCELLADAIRRSGHTYDKLLCISRGGIFVGGLVAHMLGLRNITTIALKLYEFDRQGQVVEEISGPDLPLRGSRILAVDDLLDSGRTLAYIVHKWGEEYIIDTAVLYDKGGGDLRPTFATREIPNEWVCFPWEQPLPGTGGNAK